MSSVILTLVLCSSEILRILHSLFIPLTTPQHMSKQSLLEIPSDWFILVLQNDSERFKIFDEIDQKWDLAMSVVSTNQDWKYVLILLCQENAIKTIGVVVLSLLPPTVQLEDVSQHYDLVTQTADQLL